jgi:hypothetical protein
MTSKMVNVLIGCVLIGLLIYFTSQVFKNNYASGTTGPKPTVVQNKPEPTMPLSVCDGPYVDVPIGSAWKYTITSITADPKTPSKSKTTISHITTTLLKKEVGKMSFSSIDSTTKEKSTLNMICKSDGIYGLPIPLPSSTISLLPSNLFETMSQQLMFMPNRRVHAQKKWTSTIDISQFIPIKVDSYPIGIIFIVEEEKAMMILSKKDIQTVTIKTSALKEGSIDLGTFLNVSYNLAEKIGLTSGTLQISMPGKGKISTDIKLTGFSSPL